MGLWACTWLHASSAVCQKLGLAVLTCTRWPAAGRAVFARPRLLLVYRKGSCVGRAAEVGLLTQHSAVGMASVAVGRDCSKLLWLAFCFLLLAARPET